MKDWMRWVLAAARVAGWAPLAVFLAHVLASRVLGTYLIFPSLDVPMHLLGGAAITYFFRSSLRLRECRAVIGALSPTAVGLFSLAATGTATIFWELAEWASDRFLGTHAQIGLDDTLLDMSLGLVGGLVLTAAPAARLERTAPA